VAHLRRGVVLLSDYGYTRADYFVPERNGGTLACFFRQRVHGDAFLNPGAQDITAWVDFTAVAEAAIACDLEVGGYATQAHFLLSLGMERELERSRAQLDDRQWAALAASANMLLLPGEMGERFKVMALTRDYEAPLAGFAFRDLTATL
jgi:SAM-dependent MidA family methyltransferase